MNDLQKSYIINARKLGASYKEIADKTGLSKDSVKKYCKRAGLASEVQSEEPASTVGACRCCGKSIISRPGKKSRIFCSRECGLKWWAEHPEQRKPRIHIELICPQCGSTFINTRNRSRKFCSVSCAAAFHRKEALYEAQ